MTVSNVLENIAVRGKDSKIEKLPTVAKAISSIEGCPVSRALSTMPCPKRIGLSGWQFGNRYQLPRLISGKARAPKQQGIESDNRKYSYLLSHLMKSIVAEYRTMVVVKKPVIKTNPACIGGHDHA